MSPNPLHRADALRQAAPAYGHRSCRTLGDRMVGYTWSCHACNATNEPERTACLACGCPAHTTVREISAYRPLAFASSDQAARPHGAVSPVAFLFGFSRWELGFILVRILFVAAGLAAIHFAFDTVPASILIAIFCGLFLGIVASVIFQYDKRHRELRSEERRILE